MPVVYNPKDFQQDYSWIARAGQQVGDFVTKLPGVIETGRALREGQVRNEDMFAAIKTEVDNLSDEDVQQMGYPDKALLIKAITPQRRQKPESYLTNVLKSYGIPRGKVIAQQKAKGEDLGRRSNLAALRSEGAGGSGTPFSSEELEGFRGQFEGTPQEKGFEGLAGQRLGAEQLGAVEGDVARQGAAGRARPTAESATGAALNVAPGKPLSKPAKELLDLLPNQLDLDRLSDQKQRQRATMGARAGAIWDRQAKQLEGRINTDMGLAQKQKDRAKDLTDDVDKLTRAIAILRNTPKENILDEEEHAKKIDALDASLAKKLTQVTKANRAVEDAVKRVNEAETSYQSFLSDEGGLKDVLNAEAGRVKPPPSSETPEQRKARLRSILTGK